jgi:hypothetical protein
MPVSITIIVIVIEIIMKTSRVIIIILYRLCAIESTAQASTFHSPFTPSDGWLVLTPGHLTFLVICPYLCLPGKCEGIHF